MLCYELRQLLGHIFRFLCCLANVISVALNLVCGFVDEATTIAQTHGGGGGGSTSGWGRAPKDDDRDWALKCLARARKMCTPTIGRKKKM